MTLLPTLPDRDARLLEAVDPTMDAAARRCGAFLACRPGFAGPTLVALALVRP